MIHEGGVGMEVDVDSGCDEDVLLRRDQPQRRRRIFGGGERKSAITTSSDELVRISEELNNKDHGN